MPRVDGQTSHPSSRAPRPWHDQPELALIELRGHASADEPNTRISRSGARVLDVLVSRGGRCEPLSDESTEEGRANNRRVAFRVAHLKSR